MKTEKYGSKIIELMRFHVNSETDGGKASAESGAKRQKKDKDVVCVESSEEED